jgi:hypothetical protein
MRVDPVEAIRPAIGRSGAELCDLGEVVGLASGPRVPGKRRRRGGTCSRFVLIQRSSPCDLMISEIDRATRPTPQSVWSEPTQSAVPDTTKPRARLN